MSPRRVKWLMYWRFIKLTKRLPRKPERTIIKTTAVMVVSLAEAEATLCGCGHGDYRTCPCEPQHPSKATGQFDHVEWPEDD